MTRQQAEVLVKIAATDEFNGFNGPRVSAKLAAYPELWKSASFHGDTLLIVPRRSRYADLLVRSLNAEEVHEMPLERALDLLWRPTPPAVVIRAHLGILPGASVIRVWWD